MAGHDIPSVSRPDPRRPGDSPSPSLRLRRATVIGNQRLDRSGCQLVKVEIFVTAPGGDRFRISAAFPQLRECSLSPAPCQDLSRRSFRVPSASSRLSGAVSGHSPWLTRELAGGRLAILPARCPGVFRSLWSLLCRSIRVKERCRSFSCASIALRLLSRPDDDVLVPRFTVPLPDRRPSCSRAHG